MALNAGIQPWVRAFTIEKGHIVAAFVKGENWEEAERGIDWGGTNFLVCIHCTACNRLPMARENVRNKKRGEKRQRIRLWRTEKNKAQSKHFKMTTVLVCLSKRGWKKMEYALLIKPWFATWIYSELFLKNKWNIRHISSFHLLRKNQLYQIQGFKYPSVRVK